jgi:Uma2 family endonuclease
VSLEILNEDGQPYAKPIHGKIIMRITFLLMLYLQKNPIGELIGESGFLMTQNPLRIRASDQALYLHENMPADDHQYYPVPPDVAVEVVSEYDSAAALREKINQYMENGTHLLWVAYRQEVVVYRPAQDERTVTSGGVLEGYDVLPGLSIAVDDIFTDSH